MKKYRIFFAAAVLTLITAIAFAKSSKFITQEMYASTSGTSPTLANSTKLTESVDLVGFSATGSTQAKISNNSSQSRFVYAYNGSSFTKLYATGW